MISGDKMSLRKLIKEVMSENTETLEDRLNQNYFQSVEPLLNWG